MKILYHHRSLADGAEGIHIAEMVAAFRALGHQVDVRGLAAGETAAGRASLVERLKQRMPAAVFEAASTATNALEYLDVRGRARAERPDFVYKRHARMDVGALLAARRAGIPSVLEVNCLFTGTHYHRFEPMALDGLAARLERRALRLADVVLAVSSPLMRDIQQFAQVEAVTLPNGADPQRFDPARAEGGTVRARFGLGREIVVGWAGIMRDWHGLELLIDAVARMPDVRLLIVGDGPSRPAVEQRARQAGIDARMVVTGRVPQDQMPHYIAAMDIAAVVSDGTRVASPMKLVEYMAMERPVVAPRLDNICDLVSDGCDGLLFTPENADDLTRVLRRLAGDAGLRSTLGSTARRTVLAVRNWRSNADRVVALVRQRLAAASGRAGWQHSTI